MTLLQPYFPKVIKEAFIVMCPWALRILLWSDHPLPWSLILLRLTSRAHTRKHRHAPMNAHTHKHTHTHTYTPIKIIAKPSLQGLPKLWWATVIQYNKPQKVILSWIWIIQVCLNVYPRGKWVGFYFFHLDLCPRDTKWLSKETYLYL